MGRESEEGDRKRDREKGRERKREWNLYPSVFYDSSGMRLTLNLCRDLLRLEFSCSQYKQVI